MHAWNDSCHGPCRMSHDPEMYREMWARTQQLHPIESRKALAGMEPPEMSRGLLGHPDSPCHLWAVEGFCNLRDCEYSHRATEVYRQWGRILKMHNTRKPDTWKTKSQPHAVNYQQPANPLSYSQFPYPHECQTESSATIESLGPQDPERLSGPISDVDVESEPPGSPYTSFGDEEFSAW